MHTPVPILALGGGDIVGGMQLSHSLSSMRESLQQWDMEGCISGQSVGSLWSLSRKQLLAAVNDEL